MDWLRFGNPEYLHLLWAIPPLIFLLLFGVRQKQKALLRFHSNVDPAHLQRHRIQAGLLLLSCIFVIFSVARPQWGAKPEAVAERLDVMLALDISTSMLAEDEQSVRRLDRAKEVMFSLLAELEGDRVGLLYFAEASFVVCPLTSDTGTLREFLAAVTTETLAHSGTRIANAIETATERLVSGVPIRYGEGTEKNATTAPDIDGQKALILFTDGEDHGGEAIEAAKAAAPKGVHIYCVGIGSPVRPVPIPLRGEVSTGATPYKRDVNGQLVLTVLDEELLQVIAKAGNGNYYHAATGMTALTTDLARLEKQRFTVRLDGEYQERFQWFVAGALILLICELVYAIIVLCSFKY